LLFVQMAFGFAFATFFILPKFFAQDLHAGPVGIGLISAMFGLAGVIAVPLVSWAFARFSARWLVAAGCALMALSAFGFSWVDDVGPLAAGLRLSQGVASALVYNAGMVLVTELAPPGRLAQAIGWFASANLMMNAVAPVVAEMLAERAGFGPVFSLAGLAALLGGLLALRLQGGEPPPRRSSLWAVARSENALRMAAVLLAVGVGFGVMFFFSPPFALTLGIRNVGGFFIAFTAGALFVRVFLGGIADFFGYRRVSLVAVVLYAVSIAVMSRLAPGRLEWMGALFGLAQGFLLPAFTALVVQSAQPHERGQVMVLFNGYFGAGSSAVVLLGVAASSFGYPSVFMATGLLVLLAPVLLLRWPIEARRYGVS
jgi:MFS transporter, DHA1 family, multidrug resistance protein